jgi:hypothetical protein
MSATDVNAAPRDAFFISNVTPVETANAVARIN